MFKAHHGQTFEGFQAHGSEPIAVFKAHAIKALKQAKVARPKKPVKPKKPKIVKFKAVKAKPPTT
jgi:hypothetical protein